MKKYYETIWFPLIMVMLSIKCGADDFIVHKTMGVGIALLLGILFFYVLIVNIKHKKTK